MGNCTVSTTLVDVNLRVPQPQDETIIQTEKIDYTKKIIQSCQIPFDIYVLIEFTNMTPIFLSSNIMYKRQKYDQISKTIRKVKGIIFRDECFNVNNTINSIVSYIDESIKEIKKINKYDLKVLNTYKIIPLKDLYTKNNTLDKFNSLFQNVKSYSFSNSIKDNITFGPYGNVNLVNVIKIMMDKDAFWIKNILHKYDCEVGIFIIKLYIQGLPKHVLLDQNVVVDDKGESAFINPSYEYFWIVLIEKAIAKVSRSYGNSIRCYASELVTLLNEIPLMKLKHNNIEKKVLWKKIKESVDNNNNNTKQICFCERDKCNNISSQNTNNNILNELINMPCSIQFLSFYIEQVFKIENTKYIELKLPIYNTIITEQLNQFKSHINKEIPISHIQNNNTIFTEHKLSSPNIYFIPFDLYCNYFTNTYIYKYKDEYIYTTKKIALVTNQFTMVKLNPLKKAKTIISLHIKDSRYSSQSVPYFTSQMILVKMRINETFIKQRKKANGYNVNNDNSRNKSNNNNNNISNSNNNGEYNLNIIDSTLISRESFYFEEESEYLFEYVTSAFSSDFITSIDVSLDPNEKYYLLIKLITNSSLNRKCVLSLYSSSFIDIVEHVELNPEKESYTIDQKLFLQQNLTTLTKSLINIFLFYTENKLYTITEHINNIIKITKSKNETLNFGYFVLKIENIHESDYALVSIVHNCSSLNLITLKLSGKVKESQKIISETHNQLDLVLSPGGSELLIFERLSEASLFDVKYIVKETKNASLISRNSFMMQKTNKINENIYYQEVPYSKGVYVILINSSYVEYVVRAIFDICDNLEVDETYDNEVEMILKPQSKSFMNLKIKNKNYNISYQITFLSKIYYENEEEI